MRVNCGMSVLFWIEMKLNKYNTKLLELVLGCQNLQVYDLYILKLDGNPCMIVDIVEN